MKTLLIRGLVLIAGVGMLGLSFYLSESAFMQVLDFRTLERIPLSEIRLSVGGESQIRGRADVDGGYLTAPRSDTACLYYRYLVEKKETDSDGDTSWRTVRDEKESLDFYLTDESARAFVRARESEWSIHWSIQEKYYQQSGDYRYTEWRIDPGDELTIFGWLSLTPDPVINFSSQGHYRPIISSFTAASERADLALGAILRLWGGVTSLIVACFCLIYVMRVHKTLVFLMVISFSGSVMLIHYGYRSAQADVVQGAQRVEQQSDRALGLINQAFTDNGLLAMSFSANFDLNSLAYSLMSDDAKDQVNAWRRSAYLVRARYVKQIDRFPESLIASQRGVGLPPVIVLPPAELAKVEAAERDYAATKTQVSRWWLLLLLGLTAAASWFSFRAIKIKRMQENIPTSKTAGIVYGLAEVKGTLLADESTEILTGPLTGNDCSWYHYVIEEQRGSGKNKSWHVIQDEIVKRPFYCEDDEGKIRIFPGSAECITQHVETDRVGNRRYTERRLSPGDQLYVLGKAKLDKTTGETLVFGHEKGSPYIIANIPEEEVMVRKARKGMGLMAFSLSMLFLGALMLVSGNGDMSSVDFLLASLIAPAFMLFVVFALMYNDLIFLKQRCDRNWANIQVSLKKRANLVPQLEQVVKQYLSHEAELQRQLVVLRERRSGVNNSQDFDDYMALEHSAIAQVRARIEQYPDLEGIDLISVFNRRLIKLENEVALIRAGFNDAVTEYQMRCQTFPDNLFAKTFNFPVRDLLHYTEGAHRVPNVTRLKSE